MELPDQEPGENCYGSGGRVPKCRNNGDGVLIGGAGSQSRQGGTFQFKAVLVRRQELIGTVGVSLNFTMNYP